MHLLDGLLNLLLLLLGGTFPAVYLLGDLLLHLLQLLLGLLIALGCLLDGFGNLLRLLLIDPLLFELVGHMLHGCGICGDLLQLLGQVLHLVGSLLLFLGG